MSLWSDRLAEVWAPPGRAGAGVVVGERGVLTARHVIEKTLAGEGGSPRARVVRPGVGVGDWLPMAVIWEDEGWDVALLSVDSRSAHADRWLAPDSPPAVIVALGVSAEAACEAVGFPQSEVVDDAWSARVRQTEQVVGTVMPAGQGKPPVRPERPLWSGRWVPLDVQTATPGTQAGWSGMSGAGVVLPDGRLIGLVVTAESGHDERRLYVVPLAGIFERTGEFAAALEGQTGRREIPQARRAPVWERLIEPDCLGGDGLPPRVSALGDLGAFGVKDANVSDEPPYLAYVPRDAEEDLRSALERAVATRRMLLVVGGSAAGKSRSAAEAVRRRFPDHRLLRPQAGKLADVLEASFADAEPTVVWLDDVQYYAHDAFGATLKRLLALGVVVVATIREKVMDDLDSPGDIRNATGDALTDETLVERVRWPTRWSRDERDRVAHHVRAQAVLNAVTGGTPLGAYCVAGPKLVQWFTDAQRARNDNPAPFALVRTVLDWYRTGITRPMPVDEATRLAATRPDLEDSLEPDELRDALEWATTSAFTVPRRSRQQALLITDSQTRSLTPHDYVLDYDQRTSAINVPDSVWNCAIAYATDDDRDAIGSAAYQAAKVEVAVRALIPLAESGNARAMFNVGVLLEDEDPAAARGWYERAAEAGHAGAMNGLGLMVVDEDRGAARDWWERAAEAGDSNAMNNLGVLLEDEDPAAARDWYERAAEAGHARAMSTLGILLRDEDPAAARDWYERAAEAGHATAMFNLGVLAAGEDPAAARDWYERAAEAGHAGAMFNLGVLLDGEDPAAARDWYERAAEAGHAGAMFNLGVLLDGEDPAAARDWYERAAEAGDSDAMVQFGVLLAGEDPAAARDWWERAAEAGDRDAMFNLGVLLDEEDPAAARDWWERSAEAGHAGAMFNLGVLAGGEDPAAARDWYERAAEAGHAGAMFNLGLLVVGEEPLAARGWWERAAEAGDGSAMFNLGVLLENEDPAAARDWYERAAEAGHAGAMSALGILLKDEDPAAARQWYERGAETGKTDDV